MSKASQFNNFLGPALISRQPNNFANSAAKLTTNTRKVLATWLKVPRQLKKISLNGETTTSWPSGVDLTMKRYQHGPSSIVWYRIGLICIENDSRGLSNEIEDLFFLKAVFSLFQ